MNINETDDKKIVFNTPLNFNISENFPEFSKKHLPKIEYLLNQINWCKDNRGYQINIDNHAWSLCLNNGNIISIINRLIDLNIIKKASEHVEKLFSNGYSMVQPYTNETSTKSFYNVDEHLFLQKLKADKWVAKGKQHSSFVKAPATTGKAKVNSDARILQLEAFIANNGLSIPAYPVKHGVAVLHHDEAQPKPEAIAITVQPEAIEEPVMTLVKPDELVVRPEIKAPETAPDYTLGMTPLNADLSIHINDDYLYIDYLDQIGSISKYDQMAWWFTELNTSEKINLFELLMKAPGALIKYQLNHCTYAKLYKRVEEDFICVDYIEVENIKAA